MISQDDADIPSKKGELYLPVNPILIWNAHKLEQARVFNEEKVKDREMDVFELGITYRKNFGDFGIGSRRTNISIINSYRWLLYTIANVLKHDHGLSMMLGDITTFESQYADFCDSMLELHKGIRIKLLVEPTDELNKIKANEPGQGIDNLKKLMEKNPDINFEIGETPIPHATSRMIICEEPNGSPYMSLDEWKILPINRPEPSYMGTIYLESNSVTWMKNKFDASWIKRQDIIT